MEYRPLGKTGLTVSVAGLGCGGNSRLGLGRGASFDDCVAVVRTAVDLGVNFLDTAEAYGTEEIVGAAVRSYDRTKLVISTKAIFNTGDTGETVTRKVEAALRRLNLDYVDVFHFHAVSPAAYDHHRDVLAPALVKMKEQGKVRHVGITETSPNDPEQKMLARAIEEEPWEVTMLAYSLMNQGARRKIFPVTQRRGIGTLLMFVVRNIFSNAAYRADIFAGLVEQGHLDASILATAIRSGSWLPKAVCKASRTPPIATRATSRASMSFSSEPATRRTSRPTSARYSVHPGAADHRAASRHVRRPDRRRPRPARSCQKVIGIHSPARLRAGSARTTLHRTAWCAPCDFQSYAVCRPSGRWLELRR